MHRETPEKRRPIDIVVTGFKQAVAIKIARPMKILATGVKRSITTKYFAVFTLVRGVAIISLLFHRVFFRCG